MNAPVDRPPLLRDMAKTPAPHFAPRLSVAAAMFSHALAGGRVGVFLGAVMSGIDAAVPEHEALRARLGLV